MVELFANSECPNQTPRSVASDLGLHCLPVTRGLNSSVSYKRVFKKNIVKVQLENDKKILFAYISVISNKQFMYTLQCPNVSSITLLAVPPRMELSWVFYTKGTVSR